MKPAAIEKRMAFSSNATKPLVRRVVRTSMKSPTDAQRGRMFRAYKVPTRPCAYKRAVVIGPLAVASGEMTAFQKKAVKMRNSPRIVWAMR